VLVVAARLSASELSLAGVPRAFAIRQDNNFTHMAAFAIIDRSVFIPYLFTGWTSVSPTTRNAGLFASSGSPLTPEQLAASALMDGPDSPYAKPGLLGERPYWRDWRRHFDYLVWIGFDDSQPPLDSRLKRVGGGSFFAIDRILR